MVQVCDLALQLFDLLNNSLNSTLQKIPGIGDIPILGLLFKSKAANKEQTELVVMITPQILTRNSSGVTTALPCRRNISTCDAPVTTTRGSAWRTM